MTDSDTRRVFEKLDELSVGQASIKAEITARLDALPCEEHRIALYGNGRSGLLERTRSLEQKSEDSETHRTERSADWRWIVAMLLAGIVFPMILKKLGLS